MAIPPQIAFSTWDYTELWDELAASSVPGLATGYPLVRSNVAVAPGASSTINFDLRSSAARYFRLTAGAAHPDMLVQFSTSSGANVPNGARARVIVVRTR